MDGRQETLRKVINLFNLFINDHQSSDTRIQRHIRADRTDGAGIRTLQTKTGTQPEICERYACGTEDDTKVRRKKRVDSAQGDGDKIPHRTRTRRAGGAEHRQPEKDNALR